MSLTSDLVHPSVDILEQFSPGSRPTFSVVSNEQFLAELSANSSTAVLPPQFLISLSYRPDNNTVLRLFTVELNDLPSPQDTPSSTLGSQRNDSIDTSTPQLVGSVVLSSSVTLIRYDGYLELWNSMSHSLYHSVELLISNGDLYICVDGEMRPAVSFWLPTSSQSLQLSFSPHLHSVTSVVSRTNYSYSLNELTAFFT